MASNSANLGEGYGDDRCYGDGGRGTGDGARVRLREEVVHGPVDALLGHRVPRSQRLGEEADP